MIAGFNSGRNCGTILEVYINIKNALHPNNNEGAQLGSRSKHNEQSTIEFMSETDVHEEVQEAWNKLRECQWSATELRVKWLESFARYKATVEGDTDAAKTIETMIKNLHEKQMHHKLSYITKGARSGLDYTKVPTAK